ncbi:MAG: prohibitin family protein [Dehalococcoidia bacterium]|nr:prohibitin family protein [Dehalococcoidia bacterium]
MFFKIIGLIIMFFTIGGTALYFYWVYQKKEKVINAARYNERSPGSGLPEVKAPRYRWEVLAAAVLLLLVSFTISAGTTSVQPGHKGVVVMWGGAVEERIAQEGLNFIMPGIEKVVEVDTRVQAHEFKNIDAASKEMQSVTMTGNVNWNFDGKYVNEIYQTIGANSEFVNKVLDKALQDFLKEVTPQYSITEILPRRGELRQKAVDVLTKNLERYHVLIRDIYIADIQFSFEYMAAIEKQQVAERQVTTERNILEQKRIIAEQVNIEAVGYANASATKAEGEKRAAITTSEGQAQAILTVAQAQAQANELINVTLSQNLIQYTYAEKLAPGTKVIVLPSNSPFILPADYIK